MGRVPASKDVCGLHGGTAGGAGLRPPRADGHSSASFCNVVPTSNKISLLNFVCTPLPPPPTVRHSQDQDLEPHGRQEEQKRQRRGNERLLVTARCLLVCPPPRRPLLATPWLRPAAGLPFFPQRLRRSVCFTARSASPVPLSSPTPQNQGCSLSPRARCTFCGCFRLGQEGNSNFPHAG